MHIAKGIAQTPFEHQQARGIKNLSGEHVPVLDHPHSSDFFLLPCLNLPCAQGAAGSSEITAWPPLLQTGHPRVLSLSSKDMPPALLPIVLPSSG